MRGLRGQREKIQMQTMTTCCRTVEATGYRVSGETDQFCQVSSQKPLHLASLLWTRSLQGSCSLLWKMCFLYSALFQCPSFGSSIPCWKRFLSRYCWCAVSSCKRNQKTGCLWRGYSIDQPCIASCASSSHADKVMCDWGIDQRLEPFGHQSAARAVSRC